MRRLLLASFTTAALSAFAPRANAQSAGAATVPTDQMTAYARAWIAVNEIRDKAYAELAEPRNKKIEDQSRIRTRLKDDIAAALKAHGLTQKQFDDLTQLVSSNDERRKEFDAAVTQLTARKPASPPEDRL